MKKSKIKLHEILPVRLAPQFVWDNISNQLDIKNTINDLPTHKADKEIWDKIEFALDSKQSYQYQLNIPFILKIAASILIIVSILTYSTLRILNKNEVKYSTYIKEVKVETTLYSNDNRKEVADLSVQIKNICKNHPMICESEVYNELNKELYKLEQERLSIINSLEKYKSEDYTKHLFFIENEKIKIQQKLLKYIIKV